MGKTMLLERLQNNPLNANSAKETVKVLSASRKTFPCTLCKWALIHYQFVGRSDGRNVFCGILNVQITRVLSEQRRLAQCYQSNSRSF